MKALKVLVGFTLFLSIVIAPLANAEVSDAEFQQLKDMLNQALERIDELEARDREVAITQQAEIEVEAEVDVTTAEQVAANTAKLEKMSWADRIRLQGDFRYRYQPEETSGRLGTTFPYPNDDVSRNRQRIRARVAVIADLGNNIDVGFGLATGGDNPVSANATLGGTGAKKEIDLDLAYFDWKFAAGWNLAAGKFKNRFVDVGNTGLFWDFDWRPEGFDVRYRGDLLYATLLGTWLAADDLSGSGNSFNYGLQLGAKPKLGNVMFDVGAGYWMIKSDGRDCYDQSGSTGDNCFGNTKVDDNSGSVNPAGGNDIYLMDYAPVQLYAKARFGTAVPFGLFADFARNIDAKAIVGGPSNGKKLDTAYAAGGWIGAGKKRGQWQIQAYYQDKEADSVLGILTDSDFGGGGTDSKGYVLEGKYMLTGNTYVKARWLSAERQDSNGYESGDPATSNPYDVDTLQLDVQFKYK